MNNIYKKIFLFIIIITVIFLIILKKNEFFPIILIVLFLLIINYFINDYHIDNFENNLNGYCSRDAINSKKSSFVNKKIDFDNNTKYELNTEKIKEFINAEEFDENNFLDSISNDYLKNLKNEAINYYYYAKSIVDLRLKEEAERIAMIKIKQYLQIENRLKNEKKHSQDLPINPNRKDKNNKNINTDSDKATNVNVNYNNNLIRSISNNGSLNDYIMDKLF